MPCRVAVASVLFTLVLLCSLAFAKTPVCLVPPSGLVSWWTADADESDLYGVNNPFAVNGITLVPASVADGFAFGNGSYIDIPASVSLANQKFTWDAWVRPDGPGPNNDQYGSIIVQQDIDSTHLAVSLYWRANPDNRFVFLFGDQFSEAIFSQDTFPPGAFYFVAATYDGSAFRLYVNGVPEGSFVEKKTINYSSRTWEIGSSDAASRGMGFARTWNGVIDEVEAFNVALSQAKIQSIYKAGSAGKCKAAVILTPAKEAFGRLTVGTTSPAKTVTVINNRDADLTMNGLTFAGADPADFAEASTTCGSTLAARKSCKVGVTFTPQAVGRRTASLDVSDSADGSPQTVNLSGTGQ